MSRILVLTGTIVLAALHCAAADEPDDLLAAARRADQQRNWAAAKQACDELLKGDPDRVDAYYWRGRANFCLSDFRASVADFDQYIRRVPSAAPRQWERGIACYYASKFEAGAEQFKLYQTYHDNDVENSVWRYLCMARIKDVGPERAREAMLPIRNDPRPGMMKIYDLYRGKATVDDVWEDIKRDNPQPAQLSGRMFYARLYVGLYHEAQGNHEQARRQIDLAADKHAKDASEDRVNHFMYDVAVVHQKRFRQAPKSPPNIVLIMADDLGYGDLGCYGQKRIATPRIDALARQGMRFTDFYAGSTVCAPSRCVLMTGLHTGHAFIRGNGKDNLRPSDITVAEVLKGGGYATGMFGKWGLGHEGSTGLPTRQGFDEFFGYLDQHHAHNYYPSFLIDGAKRVQLDNVVPNEGQYGQGKASQKNTYSHDLIVERALQFVDRHHDRPFFLYLPLTVPHANNEAGREGMEIPDYGRYAELDWPEPQKGHAAMITRMDADVGRLLDRLAKHGIADNTLVLFTSDNGPHAEGGNDPDFQDSNGPLKGIKRSLTEGGIRVPMIAQWPGVVEPGSVSPFAGAFWDVLPTLADVAEVKAPQVDGLSLLPTLTGVGQQPQHEHLYWAFYERGGARALRMKHWKAVQQPYRSPVRLYHLKTDLGEEHDVAAEHPELLAEMVKRMDAEYAPSDRWKFPQPR